MPGNPKRRAILEEAGMWPPPAGMSPREALALIQGRAKDERKVDWRRKAQTDLYWLAAEVFDLPLVPRVHKPVTDLFVEKDPAKPLFEQSPVKRRMLLYPRNTFKSTLSQINLVQWILCFPNVRILVMRGQRALAKAMIEEIIEWFTSHQKLLELFPEFKIKRASANNFVVPCRTVARREPTIAIGTPDSKKTGQHPDIIVCDDLVDELNSTTPEQLAKVARAYHLLTPMLETGGYLDVIGTRYHPADLYGALLEQAAASPDEWKVLCAAAWTLKPGAKAGSELKDDHELLYPERLSWAYLNQVRSEFRRTGDERIFDCQYLNIPSLAVRPGMDQAAIQRRTIPADQITARRQGAPMFQAWDLAYSKKRASDYTICATGFFDVSGGLNVVDLYRDRPGAYATAAAIVGEGTRWQPVRIGIEDSLGVQFLSPQIAQLAAQARLDSPIDWLPTGRQADMKRTRRLTLEAWLTNGKLWFSSACRHLEELRAQLCGESAKDDICDALAHLLSYHGMVHVRTHFEAREEMEQQDSAPPSSLHPGLRDVLGYGLTG